MRLPSSTRSRAGCGRAATSSKMLGCWVLAIEVKIYQQVISLVTGLAAPSIFGIYSGPHLELGNDPDTPPGERFRRVLLDPVVCAAVRSGATIGARVPSPTRRAALTRRSPPAVAGIAARPARGGEAGDDGEPGDRTVRRAQAVRARPGALRRAVRAAARGARPCESGRRAYRAGARVRGDGRVGGAVRCAAADRGSDSIADCGMRIADWKFTRRIRNPQSAIRNQGGVGPRQVRLLGRGHSRAAGGSGHRTSGGRGEVSLLPAARRAAARSRHAPPVAPARPQDARAPGGAPRGRHRVAVRPDGPPAVAARGGPDGRAGDRAPDTGADHGHAHLLLTGGRAGDAGARAGPAGGAGAPRSASQRLAGAGGARARRARARRVVAGRGDPQRSTTRSARARRARSEEHTSELQSRENLVCRLLLEQK